MSLEWVAVSATLVLGSHHMFQEGSFMILHLGSLDFGSLIYKIEDWGVDF